MAYCDRTKIGRIPLIDGPGLYGNGSNEPPAAHLQRGLDASRLMTKLLPTGTPGTGKTAKFVVMAAGMSNWKQEVNAMIALYRQLYGMGQRMAFLNTCQGGQDAVAMVQNSAAYWAKAEAMMAKRNIFWPQVQVLLLKNSIARQYAPPAALEGYLGQIIDTVISKAPNLRQVFISSAGYSGYCSSGVRLEPAAYEEGLAVRSLILNRMGKPGPWIGWGPYCWADGVTPRSDGLTWLCPADFGNDGVHLSTAGYAKWAKIMMKFFQTDPVASGWFLG